jgi:hypothetical protein
MEDANQHEQLIERRLVKESKWRYRPKPGIARYENRTFTESNNPCVPVGARLLARRG